MSFEEIKTAVLALPANEQAQLIEILDEHLDVPLVLTPEQWAELDQSLAESESDPGVPWAVVHAELKSELDAVQRARESDPAASPA